MPLPFMLITDKKTWWILDFIQKLFAIKGIVTHQNDWLIVTCHNLIRAIWEVLWHNELLFDMFIYTQ